MNSMLRSTIKKTIKGGWKITTTGLALYGAYTLSPSVYDFYLDREKLSDKNKKSTKKKVLVLPFDQIYFTERAKPRFTIPSSFKSLSSKIGNEDKRIDIEIKDFVSLIQKAAADPEIAGLYGTCLEGGSIKVNGLAQLEEIRNAILFFREKSLEKEENGSNGNESKGNDKETNKSNICEFFTYGLDDYSGLNKQYYLASAFRHITLQNKGEVSIFGLSQSSLFFKTALEYAGIKVHVFKHGLYKNAPNTFTEDSYTPEHGENVLNLITSLQEVILQNINTQRMLSPSKKNFNPALWEAIMNYGTMTAENAAEVGLIDSIVQVSGEHHLQKKFQKDHKGKGEEMKDKEPISPISLLDYKDKIEQAEKQDKREKHLKDFWNFIIHFWDPEIKKAFFDERKVKKEKIIILPILGTITSETASSVVSALKAIKKDDDIKGVILRVDSPGGSAAASEVILAECKDLHKPIICSMGNFAASGGYYVASNCNKIFSSKNTITGSIGVFGVKLDVTELTSKYGIGRDCASLTENNHSQAMSPLQSLTPESQEVIQRIINKIYHDFKTVVSDGRKLTIGNVEEISQGKVYTGIQAKEIGLVDEFGGINDAISFAQSNYTTNHNANIEVWPKQSLRDLAPFRNNSSTEKVQGDKFTMTDFDFLFDSEMKKGIVGPLLIVDEVKAINFALKDFLGSSESK